ncbi:hypothetical protein AGR2A_pa40164 [Agrobacterium genomosp. 2 str. CFBP 5494]|uniref:Uncharacterized protein n=1 Tax=Agrobacterium genomosp. 2 str. CFBP 5494 TaxID=1183436 RepID=A0A9W5F2T0_9HYPH|nr:hypothetical protein AGR2A_pa40164 [Agrobacterium genomosp. 2 str. CFBP 5494]
MRPLVQRTRRHRVSRSIGVFPPSDPGRDRDHQFRSGADLQLDLGAYAFPTMTNSSELIFHAEPPKHDFV